MKTLVIVAALLLEAQAPEFTVVSIKRHLPTQRAQGGGRGANMTKFVSDPRMMTLRNVTIGEMIEMAYDVTAERVEGRPDWLYQKSYDVSAVSSSPTTAAQQRIMLRAVLAERAGLVCHAGEKDGLVYDLVAGRKPTLKESRLETAELARFNPRLVVHEDGTTETVFSSPHASISDLATWLSSSIGAPVTDKTGIAGSYDISLNVPGPTMNPDGAHVVYQRDDSREIAAAVQEQLGLRLNPQKHGKIQTLVIEHISEPSEN